MREHFLPVIVLAAAGLLILINLMIDLSFVRSPRQLIQNPDSSESSAPAVPIGTVSTSTLDWMGQPPVVAAPPPVEVVLPLPVEVKLKGTFTDSEGQLASALIAVGGGEALRYFVGDRVHEGLILQKVTEEWIELAQNGAVNRVYFPFTQERPAAVPRSRRARMQEFQVSPAPESVTPSVESTLLQ
jgi:hypothetical protein